MKNASIFSEVAVDRFGLKFWIFMDFHQICLKWSVLVHFTWFFSIKILWHFSEISPFFVLWIATSRTCVFRLRRYLVDLICPDTRVRYASKNMLRSLFAQLHRYLVDLICPDTLSRFVVDLICSDKSLRLFGRNRCSRARRPHLPIWFDARWSVDKSWPPRHAKTCTLVQKKNFVKIRGWSDMLR